METTRAMLSWAHKFGYDVRQTDVISAFQNSKIDHDVYVELPEGVNCDWERFVWKLEKALYGLATAAKSWYDLVDKIMSEHGLKRLITDSCVYVSNNCDLVALVYMLMIFYSYIK